MSLTIEQERGASLRRSAHAWKFLKAAEDIGRVSERLRPVNRLTLVIEETCGNSLVDVS